MDSPDYLLTQIIETSVDMQSSQTMEAALWVATVAFVAIAAVGAYLWWRQWAYDWVLFAAGATCAILTALIALAMGMSVGYEQMALDGLIASYEALYGPLPEGII